MSETMGIALLLVCLSANIFVECRQLNKWRNFSIDLTEDWDAKNTSDPLVLQMRFYESKMIDSMTSQNDGSIIEGLNHYNLSEECTTSSMFLMEAMMSFEPWALRMMDASSKMPAGIFYGSVSSFGNYDECLDATAYDSAGEEGPQLMFKGKYCAVDYSPKRPKSYDPEYLSQELPKGKIFRKMMLNHSPVQIAVGLQLGVSRYGFCIPSTCSLEDAYKLQAYLNNYFKTNGTVRWCRTKADLNRIDSSQTLAFICIVGLILLVSVATIVDYRSETDSTVIKRKSFWKEIFLSVSASRTYSKLASNDSFDKRLTFVYGVRFLSFIWVIYAHTYFVQNLRSVGNTVKLESIPKQFLFQIFMNGTLAAESFFFMSGFVVAIFIVESFKESSSKWSIIQLYASRVWRQIPVILFSIGVSILLPLFGSGPIFEETIKVFSSKCYTNWPGTVLFYSNFLRPIDMCLPHSWYISLDAQLFLVAPVLTLILCWKPKLGIVLTCLLCLSSMAWTAVQTIIKNYPPVPIFQVHSIDFLNIMEDYASKMLFRPILHLCSYTIGVGSGVFVARSQTIFSMPNWMSYLGWIFSTVCKLAILFAVYPWNKGDIIPTPTTSALYAATCRTIWSLTFVWDVVAGSYGHGRWVVKVLSWSPFIKLSRLTFSAYMMFPLLMIFAAANNRATYHFTHFLMFQRFCGFLVMTYAAAFLVMIVIEMPLISMERVFREFLSERNQPQVLGTVNKDSQDQQMPSFRFDGVEREKFGSSMSSIVDS